MFCAKCGKELFDEAVMCPQCGTPTKNFEAPVQQESELVAEATPTRMADVKIMYHVGEIGGKMPMKLNLEYGDFFFEENELVIESYLSAAKVKSGTIRGEYEKFRFKTLYSKQMLVNKFKVLIIEAEGFVISVYALDGFMGKQFDNVASSASPGSLAEYNATLSKLEKIENMLKSKTGGQ